MLRRSFLRFLALAPAAAVVPVQAKAPEPFLGFRLKPRQFTATSKPMESSWSWFRHLCPGDVADGCPEPIPQSGGLVRRDGRGDDVLVHRDVSDDAAQKRPVIGLISQEVDQGLQDEPACIDAACHVGDNQRVFLGHLPLSLAWLDGSGSTLP